MKYENIWDCAVILFSDLKELILFDNVLEQTTFLNEESAIYCKDRQIVNIYIYKYVNMYL